MKTLLVRYRRWGLTLVVLLIPIIYNLLSNIISRSQNAAGTFEMKTNLLDPQTILYHVDPSLQRYFQSSVDYPSSDVKLLERTDNISQMNQYIKREFSCFLEVFTFFFVYRTTNRSSINLY